MLRLIEAERVTNWGGVPTMVSRLVEHGDLSAYDLSSLRTMSVSSAPSAAHLKERLRQRLPVAGASLGTTYGMTESSTAATWPRPRTSLPTRKRSVGRSPRCKWKSAMSRASGFPTEWRARCACGGAQMMLGYWRNPEATAQSTAPHGWFRSGDLGTMVDGQLRISSRRTDLILRGGENVYPTVVENQLATHPAVRECAVLGTAHEDLGERWPPSSSCTPAPRSSPKTCARTCSTG